MNSKILFFPPNHYYICLCGRFSLNSRWAMHFWNDLAIHLCICLLLGLCMVGFIQKIIPQIWCFQAKITVICWLKWATIICFVDKFYSRFLLYNNQEPSIHIIIKFYIHQHSIFCHIKPLYFAGGNTVGHKSTLACSATSQKDWSPERADRTWYFF